MNELFRKFAHRMSLAMGSSWAFCIAFLFIAIWLISGPVFDFSSTWQLVINTVTTIVTFLMIFLVQNAQNRDAKAMQLKLDDLIQAQKKTHQTLVGVEDKPEEVLDRDKEIVDKKVKKSS